MSQNDSLESAAKKALIDCMGAKTGESVLIISDPSRRKIGLAVWDTVRELGFDAMYNEIPVGKVNGEEPPKVTAELMKNFDVILIPTAKSLTHTKARREASENGARIATLPGITEDVMIRGLNADYNKIAALTLKLKEKLESVSWIRVTSEIGTDITMSVKGRKILPSKGIFHARGESGNLPTGETFAAPVEGSSNGVFVVDGSMAGIGVIDGDPIRVVVKNGMAVEITGDTKAELLNEMLDKVGPQARNIAEIGIGTNEKVILSGVLLEDEKKLGTVHIALGNNKSMGGSVDVPIHLDGVIKSPDLYFDDRLVMSAGKFIDEELKLFES